MLNYAAGNGRSGMPSDGSSGHRHDVRSRMLGPSLVWVNTSRKESATGNKTSTIGGRYRSGQRLVAEKEAEKQTSKQ